MLNTEKLVKLIKENPDADLMPMVDSEMGHPDYAMILGEIKDIRLDFVRYGDQIEEDLSFDKGYFDEFAIFFKSQDSQFLKKEIKRYLELYNKESGGSQVNELFNKIKWDKVIVLEISDC